MTLCTRCGTKIVKKALNADESMWVHAESKSAGCPRDRTPMSIAMMWATAPKDAK